MEIEDFKFLFSKVHEAIKMQEKKRVFSIVLLNNWPIVRIEHDEYVLREHIRTWYAEKYAMPYFQVMVVPEPTIIQCDLKEYDV